MTLVAPADDAEDGLVLLGAGPVDDLHEVQLADSASDRRAARAAASEVARSQPLSCAWAAASARRPPRSGAAAGRSSSLAPPAAGDEAADREQRRSATTRTTTTIARVLMREPVDITGRA